MKLVICENYAEMSEKASKIIMAQVMLKPNSILGLATGSTPVGMYSRLKKMSDNEEVDFSEVQTFNLDEYYPIEPENEQSYRYFMNKNLFSGINIKLENTHVPCGNAKDAESVCKAYDEAIAAAGGIDIQVLGIGRNGHIGFNEPADCFYAPTHVTELTQNTIDANARFFESADLVPKKAITMGMTSIMQAKKILMLVSGKNKHEALMGLLSGKITPQNQATLINIHKDVVILCDAEAYNG